jgi:DNA polymerase-3 subunit alpha
MYPNHHREFTEGNICIEQINKNKEKYKLPKTVDGKWCKLVHKVSVGIKDVYDISMMSPHHNFIAGGIIVHNCLEAIRDGKTVSSHYIDKKNGQESIDYFHSALEPILKTTYGEMVYQEQAMEIAKTIAGFNLQEADMLRKAIGKKKPEEMAKVKTKFIDGAKDLGIINENEAEEIFGWIEKSQRYSFNKSHSISYAMNAYLSAYSKAHFPKVFFASYLRYAKDKIDPQSEIKELVQNASEMDISIRPPDIRLLNEYFILYNNQIYFGLTDIKGVGDSVFHKLIGLISNNNIDIKNISWKELILKILCNINSTAAKALIESGATSFIKKTRNEMLFELNIVSSLTKKESLFLVDNISNYGSILDGLLLLIKNGRVNKNRKKIIEDLINMINHPPYSTEDSPEWISDVEDNNLGCSITCSKIDMYDISMTNTNCRDFKNSHIKNNIIIGGEIDNINYTKIKKGESKGEDMAFVTISDTTGSIDSIVFFPEKLKIYKHILFPGNIIILAGSRSKNSDGLIVEKAYVAKS